MLFLSLAELREKAEDEKGSRHFLPFLAGAVAVQKSAALFFVLPGKGLKKLARFYAFLCGFVRFRYFLCRFVRFKAVFPKILYGKRR